MRWSLSRRRLLVTLGATAVAGCTQAQHPEQCMPPGTDFDVAYEQAVTDGSIGIRITGPPALATDRIRVTVGETVAYDGGDIRAEYTAGADASDGWGVEAAEGEQLVLSTDGPIPGLRRLSIEVRSSCDHWDQRARSRTPPPPMTISATAERRDGTTYLTITHEHGTDFAADNVRVLIPGTEGIEGYLRGRITDAVDGPAVIDEWSDGVSPGDRLRLATPDPDPVGRPITVGWYGHPSGELEAIARTTIQAGPSMPTETATASSRPSETAPGESISRTTTATENSG